MKFFNIKGGIWDYTEAVVQAHSEEEARVCFEKQFPSDTIFLVEELETNDQPGVIWSDRHHVPDRI